MDDTDTLTYPCHCCPEQRPAADGSLACWDCYTCSTCVECLTGYHAEERVLIVDDLCPDCLWEQQNDDPWPDELPFPKPSTAAASTLPG